MLDLWYIKWQVSRLFSQCLRFSTVSIILTAFCSHWFIRYLCYTILSTRLKKNITKSQCSDKLFLACEEPEVHFCKLYPVHSSIKLFLYIYVLLGYYVTWFGEETIKFRSNILPHSSQHKIQQVHKRWYRLAKLRGGIIQTTITLILTKTWNITSLDTRFFSFTSVSLHLVPSRGSRTKHLHASNALYSALHVLLLWFCWIFSSQNHSCKKKH
jgi:hypothetical protein